MGQQRGTARIYPVTSPASAMVRISQTRTADYKSKLSILSLNTRL